MALIVYMSYTYNIVHGTLRNSLAADNWHIGSKASYKVVLDTEYRITGHIRYDLDPVTMSIETKDGLDEGPVYPGTPFDTVFTRILVGGFSPTANNLVDSALRRIDIYHKTSPGPITTLSDEAVQTQFLAKC